MNRKTTSSIATAVIGAAIAAGTFGFTANGSRTAQADQDTVEVSTRHSDHDWFRLAASSDQGTTTDATATDSWEFAASHTGRRDERLHIADASMSVGRSDRVESGRSSLIDGQDLVGPEVRLLESTCLDTPVLDLSARQAAACGVEVADHGVDAATAGIRTASNTASRTREAAKDAAQPLIDRLTAVGTCGIDLAGQPMDVSVNDVVDCA